MPESLPSPRGSAPVEEGKAIIATLKKRAGTRSDAGGKYLNSGLNRRTAIPLD